jgi:hypothetical protein
MNKSDDSGQKAKSCGGWCERAGSQFRPPFLPIHVVTLFTPNEKGIPAKSPFAEKFAGASTTRKYYGRAARAETGFSVRKRRRSEAELAGLILSQVLHLLPVFLERAGVEVGVAVIVVALRHLRSATPPASGSFISLRSPGCFATFPGRLLGRDGPSQAMAVFAAVVLQQRSSLQVSIARFKREELLGFPPGDVATEAFGVKMAGDSAAGIGRMDERFGGPGVRRARPDFECLGMALAALFAADERAAAGMRPRGDLQTFQSISSALLIVGQHF